MKKTFIPGVLAAWMAVSMLTGCSASQAQADASEAAGQETATLADTTAQLSAPDYDFEKEYAFGDFNAHSRADMARQGGIDTFSDKEIVFEDISYDELIDLMDREGTYMIQLSGSWCHNSRAMSPAVNELAKQYGISKIYSYDFNVNNGDDGSMFVRMSNEKTTLGTKFNYMYGEFVSRYLTNLDDWIAYPKDHATALSYTNAEGKEVTVGRLQQPIIFVYNKDNTEDNSGKGNASGHCPIVYAFEEMVERDANGIYVNATDDAGNKILDESGNTVRNYIGDEYTARLQKMFDFLKDHNITIATYDKEDYMRDTFNSYGRRVFGDNETVNLYPVTYRQLEWLMNEDGNSLVLIGSPSDEQTRADAEVINSYAVKNNLRVFLYDPKIDGGVTTDRWGYQQVMDIRSDDCLANFMYEDLVDRHMTNLTAAKTTADGYPLLESPLLIAFNKDAKDSDGFAAPVMASASLTYYTDPSRRYYIEKSSNKDACLAQVQTVAESYAAQTGVSLAQ